MNFSSIIRGIFKLWSHNNICCYQSIQTLPSENRIKLPLTETRGFAVVIRLSQLRANLCMARFVIYA